MLHNSRSEHENGNENEAIRNILNGYETGDVGEQDGSKNQNSNPSQFDKSFFGGLFKFDQ